MRNTRYSASVAADLAAECRLRHHHHGDGHAYINRREPSVAMLCKRIAKGHNPDKLQSPVAVYDDARVVQMAADLGGSYNLTRNAATSVILAPVRR